MTIGGEGEKGGREAVSWGGNENEKTCAKTSPREKERAPTPPPLLLLLHFAAGAKGGYQPPKLTPGRCSTPRTGRGWEGGSRRPALFVSNCRCVYAKSLEQGCTPRRRAQWLKAFLFWDVALPARPFPLPHVVQVRDTWQRWPIGSFKPRRGSGGGGGRRGKGRWGCETMAG